MKRFWKSARGVDVINIDNIARIRHTKTECYVKFCDGTMHYLSSEEAASLVKFIDNNDVVYEKM